MNRSVFRRRLIALIVAAALINCGLQPALSEQQSIDIDSFVYRQLFAAYSDTYDTFHAVLHLSDGTEVSGFAYTDYGQFFKSDTDESGLFSAGFVADREGSIPEDAMEQALLIEDIDYGDAECGFVYAYETEPFTTHAVKDGRYIRYGVGENGAIFFDADTYQRGVCDESLGALYSFDEQRLLFNPNVGDYVYLTGLPMSTLIDYGQIQQRIDEILRQQDENFYAQEIITSMASSQNAVIAYLLSLQEETFLGHPVAELVEAASALDPMQCFRITPEGLMVIDIEDDIPTGNEPLARWMMGIACGITIAAGSLLAFYVPVTAFAVDPIIDAALDVFFRVVIENRDIHYINWKGIAVKTALNVALPLMNVAKSDTAKAMLNAAVSGAERYLTKEDTENGWNAFLTGAALSAVEETLNKAVVPEVVDMLSDTKPGQWFNKASGELDLSIRGKLYHTSENIDESTKLFISRAINKLIKLEINEHEGIFGGSYNDVVNEGGETQKHDIVAFSAYAKANDLPDTATRSSINLPVLRMAVEDHMLTASYGNSAEAVAFRAEQQSLIEAGDLRQALQMGIDDILSKFGSKYNEGILQLIAYADSLGW